MREHKYRIWADDKMMQVGWLSFDDNGKLFEATAKPCRTQYFNYPDEGVEQFILIQYTGLKDCNGVEIYEGDIVVIREYLDRGDGSCDDAIGEVMWECCKWIMMLEFSYSEELQFIIDEHKCEIIGNIHENPELLEAE